MPTLTNQKNNIKLTIGTEETIVEFDKAIIPAGTKVTAIVHCDASNSSVVYAASETIDTGVHADWSAGSSPEIQFENTIANLRLKGGAAAQVVRINVVGL